MCWDDLLGVSFGAKDEEALDLSKLSPFELAERLKAILTGHATGASGNNSEYRELRKIFLSSPWAGQLPGFIRTCRDIGEFWDHIKSKFDTYKKRREYLRAEFEPLLSRLENDGGLSPSVESQTELISRIGVPFIHDTWQKALERCEADPEGAITAARTLLESVCKVVLEEAQISYDDDGNLIKLYKAVAKELRLDPELHGEECFRKILGGCHSIAEGLAAARNQFGDSHGKGRKAYRAAPRHAHLAVNVAGAAARFLWETWEERRGEVQ